MANFGSLSNVTFDINNSTLSPLNATSNTTDQCITYLQRHNNSETEFIEIHRPTIIAISKFIPPVWWFIGIIGNIISLLVWLQPKMRHSSGYYLAALATADLCFLPLSMVFDINFTYRIHILNESGICEWYAIFYIAFQYMSPVLVLAFTVERYLSVCHPFRMVNINQSSSRKTLLIILILTLGCFALSAIQGYFWTIREGVCDLRINLGQFWVIWTWFTEMLIFAAVPLSILVLNILVIKEVKNISRLERTNMRTNSIDRRSTTLMLLGVSFYQIFTVLPATVVYVLYHNYVAGDPCMSDEEIANDLTWQKRLNYMAARILIQQVSMSHYAVNFFIYLLTGKIFRKQLYELVIVYCCKDKLRYLTNKTLYTRTTRVSLTSHRGSVSKMKRQNSSKVHDLYNNNTELGNKGSLYSMADMEETSMIQNGHPVNSTRQNGIQTRLLTCVEESDHDVTDRHCNEDTDMPTST